MLRLLPVAALWLTPALVLADAPKARDDGAPPPRVLPGLQKTGEVRLPNQWSLRPAGRQMRLGDFPVNLALHPSGQWLAVLHAGFSDHEVMIVQLNDKGPRVASRVTLDQCFYGLCFSPDGKTLFASG